MDNKELFISPERTVEKTPTEYLIGEIMADSEDFLDRDYDLVVKFVREAKQTPEQKKEAWELIGGWWMSKYGFPFEMKTERGEVLRRKYGPGEETRKTIRMQNELLQSLAQRDGAKVAKLWDQYHKEFPDQLEGVEAMFQFPELLKKTKKFNNSDKELRTTAEFFKSMCEIQFLITHFVMINSGDKPFLSQFWSVMELIAKADGTKHEFDIIRRGVVSQVSVNLILKELGMNPRLSHPREDAFEKTDMWIENTTRAQIKGSEYLLEPAMASTNETVFPGVITGSRESETYFSSKYTYDIAQFRAKIKKINPDAEGMFFAIPIHMIDFVTGKPDEKLVDFFRKKIEERKK